MAIGARWDDRITGKVSEFCRDATKIHIDVDPAEFGKKLTRVSQLQETPNWFLKILFHWSANWTANPG
ncbi:MAG: hypothetical protein Ct9H90mP9_4240 [Pseudomonadota bacterium]|nr:MAG: hypothetical protein Ct9H90mP9_4240 [Pseudomonadota bacterium]